MAKIIQDYSVAKNNEQARQMNRLSQKLYNKRRLAHRKMLSTSKPDTIFSEVLSIDSSDSPKQKSFPVAYLLVS